MELDAKVWWAWDAISALNDGIFPKRYRNRRSWFIVASPGWWLIIAAIYFVIIVTGFVLWAALCIAFVLLNCVTATLYGFFTGVYWLAWRSWHR